ncbi:MAG: hypothetical protein H7Y06_06040 [Opitutaceae bacterium]|nr:hypothetical protein [Opitutaceae bacterium]
MSTKKTTTASDISSSEHMPRFAKARPIAERYGLSPRTIFRWANAGLIRRYKVNDRVVLFNDEEVSAFIKSTRV